MYTCAAPLFDLVCQSGTKRFEFGFVPNERKGNEEERAGQVVGTQRIEKLKR